jgi:hypothetical protein
MFYTVYKVTNKISGKFYIGTHKTNNLDDNYMGSGKYLRRSIEKHGIENFTKEILFVYDTPESMFAKEAEIVNEEFLAEENTYNLKLGGFGGFDHINSNEEFRISKNKKAMKSAQKSGITDYHRNQRKKREQKYNLTPNTCFTCGDALNYEKRNNKYCSRSCSC